MVTVDDFLHVTSFWKVQLQIKSRSENRQMSEQFQHLRYTLSLESMVVIS